MRIKTWFKTKKEAIDYYKEREWFIAGEIPGMVTMHHMRLNGFVDIQKIVGKWKAFRYSGLTGSKKGVE